MPLPAVVHWEGNHWVVLYEVDADHVRISDPARGLREADRARSSTRSGAATRRCSRYTEAFEEAPEAKTSYRWLWPFFRPHRKTLADRVRVWRSRWPALCRWSSRSSRRSSSTA